jgi:hypothetical protein
MYKNRAPYICVLASSLAIMLNAQSSWAATPVPSAAKTPLASGFPGPLWEVVTPVGGTASVSNQHLFLNVPGGSNHDALLPSNQAVRAVQPIGDEDFDVSIKIDSPVVAQDANTSEGLMVLADDRNFITFALTTDGRRINLTADTVTAGVVATMFKDASFNEYQNPMYLRIARTGNDYVAYYSVDGTVWRQATRFTNTKVPTMIGPFAGNYSATPAKAVSVVMAVNWFDVL